MQFGTRKRRGEEERNKKMYEKQIVERRKGEEERGETTTQQKPLLKTHPRNSLISLLPGTSADWNTKMALPCLTACEAICAFPEVVSRPWQPRGSNPTVNVTSCSHGFSASQSLKDKGWFHLQRVIQQLAACFALPTQNVRWSKPQKRPTAGRGCMFSSADQSCVD